MKRRNLDIISESAPLLEETNSSYDSQRDFTTLDAWIKAKRVRSFFYENVVPKLPDLEKFNLDVQIRKASVSCTANIAEGYGRYYYQEGIQFYRISRGSLYELKDHLITFRDLQYITEKTFKQGVSLIEDAKVTLNGYIIYVASQQ